MSMRPDPNALLRGGPAHFPTGERIRYVEDLQQKVKVHQGNRYEHFAPSDEHCSHVGVRLRVFVWTGCTYVAE